MMYEEITSGSRTRRTLTGTAHMLAALQLDGPLLIGLALIAGFVLGWRMLDRRIRRKYGGLRIY